MPRIMREDPEERKCSRKVPEEFVRETRCYWPCPCGGTVPDAPEHCVWRTVRGSNNYYCTDSIICAKYCSDKMMCIAYKNYKKWLRERRRKDTLEFENKKRERKEEEEFENKKREYKEKK